MTRNKLALLLALIVAGVAIAGGIAYAQDSAPMTLAEDDQDPGNADRTFSLFVDGGTYLGVRTEDVSKENMARYGMRDVRGVGVTEVLKDSPAEKAGLRKDDVILRFDGEAVTSVRKLSRLVSESSPDQSVRLIISRAGSEQELTATLSKRDFGGLFRGQIHDGIFNQIEKEFPKGDWGKLGDGNWVFAMGNRRIGVSTQSLSKQLAEYFGVTEGVLITSVTENSPAARAGLKAGDVITAIDGEKVDSPGDITRALSKKETGDVSLTVVRDRNSRTVTVTPEKNPNGGLFKTGKLGTRTIVIPSVSVPDVPEMNIRIPQIVVPATPAINVTVPRRTPGARVRTVII
jgi:serine protease Do